MSTLHVTSCADDGGAATLRGRIGAAQAAGTIVFDQNCTITLTTGTLTLTQNVTIDGTGHTVTVDGAGAVTVFRVNSGVTANLTALTIQHGSTQGLTPGAGIANIGTLTLANSTISGNTAALIGGGTMTMTNCMIANNAVSDEQLLTIYPQGGGGIYNTGNHAGYLKDGGGILSDRGTLTVTNSTLTGNTSYHGGGLDISDIYHQGGTKTVANTIVAGNLPPGHHEVNGGAISGGHNLIGDADGSTGWGPSDLTGTDASPLDPLLGPLGNNGGPTQTVPLLHGSPAIDAGDDTVCAGVAVGNKDQRGATRPFGAHCDIGAFEYQVVDSLPGAKPTGPAAGNPVPLPPSRPAGSAQGIPNPLPPARP